MTRIPLPCQFAQHESPFAIRHRVCKGSMGSEEFDPPLDPKIAKHVMVLRSAGIETFESCEGGDGHAYPEPTVRFHGGKAVGLRALAAALEGGRIHKIACHSSENGAQTFAGAAQPPSMYMGGCPIWLSSTKARSINSGLLLRVGSARPQTRLQM
jgi:hypothetical protein